jgi:hypothetical protein
MALQITPEKVMLLKRIVSQHLQGQGEQVSLGPDIGDIAFSM